MNLNEAFLELIEFNKIESKEYETTIKNITTKLNDVYYKLKSDKDNCFLAGSIGRGTAIKQVM